MYNTEKENTVTGYQNEKFTFPIKYEDISFF